MNEFTQQFIKTLKTQRKKLKKSISRISQEVGIPKSNLELLEEKGIVKPESKVPLIAKSYGLSTKEFVDMYLSSIFNTKIVTKIKGDKINFSRIKRYWKQKLQKSSELKSKSNRIEIEISWDTKKLKEVTNKTMGTLKSIFKKLTDKIKEVSK